MARAPASDGEFAAQMAVHHQLAIDMGRYEATNGSRGEVRDLATEIADAQDAERTRLLSIARATGHGQTRADVATERHSTVAMDELRSARGAEVDRVYLAEMIVHHEQGVEMARRSLPVLSRADLRRMARRMIDDQTREIAEMRTLEASTSARATVRAVSHHQDSRKVSSVNYESPSKATLDCMKACADCASICAQCGFHCLHMGGAHASVEHQGAMRDCAEICGVAACLLSRNSPHAVGVCRQCAEICAACAESCESLAGGDAMMKQCAEQCRRCAAACEKLSGAAV